MHDPVHDGQRAAVARNSCGRRRVTGPRTLPTHLEVSRHAATRCADRAAPRTARADRRLGTRGRPPRYDRRRVRCHRHAGLARGDGQPAGRADELRVPVRDDDRLRAAERALLGRLWRRRRARESRPRGPHGRHDLPLPRDRDERERHDRRRRQNVENDRRGAAAADRADRHHRRRERERRECDARRLREPERRGDLLLLRVRHDPRLRPADPAEGGRLRQLGRVRRGDAVGPRGERHVPLPPRRGRAERRVRDRRATRRSRPAARPRRGSGCSAKRRSRTRTASAACSSPASGRATAAAA